MSDSGAKASYGTFWTTLETLEDRSGIDRKCLAEPMKLPGLHLPSVLDSPDTFCRQGGPISSYLRGDSKLLPSAGESLAELSTRRHKSKSPRSKSICRELAQRVTSDYTRDPPEALCGRNLVRRHDRPSHVPRVS